MLEAFFILNKPHLRSKSNTTSKEQHVNAPLLIIN